jgi:hypothetical protein
VPAVRQRRKITKAFPNCLFIRKVVRISRQPNEAVSPLKWRNSQYLESLSMNPDQGDNIFVRFHSANALRRRASLAACEAEFLALWELLPTEQLSPKAVETLLKLNAAIETDLLPQTLLDGPSMADELIQERRAEAVRESSGLNHETSDTEVPEVASPSMSTLVIPSIVDLLKSLEPEARERALLEARIQILAQEAVASSALEGITIDPKEARKAVLRQMGRQPRLL